MSGSPTLPVAARLLAHGEGLPLPHYATALAAGCDLFAAVAIGAPMMLSPGSRGLVPTALVIALPPGFEAQVRPRSGLATKHGVTVLNSPGTIDADYRGEIHVLLINHGDESFLIERGMRIAQLILAPVCRAVFSQGLVFDGTERGERGFGSTGSGNTKMTGFVPASRPSDLGKD